MNFNSKLRMLKLSYFVRYSAILILIDLLPFINLKLISTSWEPPVPRTIKSKKEKLLLFSNPSEETIKDQTVTERILFQLCNQ